MNLDLRELPTLDADGHNEDPARLSFVQGQRLFPLRNELSFRDHDRILDELHKVLKVIWHAR